MERKTNLASGIDVTREKAEYDAACKRLLSEKIILAWILKSCVDEFRAFEANVIAEQCIEGKPLVSEIPVAPDETGAVIQGVGVEQSSPTEGSVYFDIYFNAIVPDTEETVQLIINVEAQSDYYPGYPLLKRGIFYCGRMLSAQSGAVFTHSHYEKLRKVYSIWLCTSPPKSRENTITRYRMTEENFVGDIHENAQNYDLISLIMICLGNRRDKNYTGILKLLGVLLSPDVAPTEKKRILQEEFQIPMTQTVEEEVISMYHVLDIVAAENMERGVQQGIQQGIEKTRLMSIQSLMRNLHWTAEQAMDALSIPQNEWTAYHEKLKQ